VGKNPKRKAEPKKSDPKAIHNESFMGYFMALISLPHQQFG
jgi:hypothetical protein